MLEDIYKIGLIAKKYQEQVMDIRVIPDIIINMDKVYSINFKHEEEKVIFKKIEIHEFAEERQYQYLYREKASKGMNFGPTAPISKVENAINNKIITWLKNVKNDDTRMMLEELNKNKEEIIKRIKQMISTKEANLLTIKLDDKFPYDVPWMFENYQKFVIDKVFGKKQNNGTCYVCQRKDKLMVPEYGVYKFYTNDKPGAIAGGFSEKNAWRNCPVCIECQPIINLGRQYIEKNLRFSYYGLKYLYIIPSNIGQDESLEDIISIFANTNKRYLINEASKRNFEADNEQILYALRNVNNINSFRLILIKREQSAERILLDIKDIYPSRFKEMYEAKSIIDEIYKELLVKPNNNEIEHIKFNFSFFREFLKKSDDKNADNDLNKIFLSLTESIFQKNRIKLEIILPHIMRKLRKTWSTKDYEDDAYILTLKAMAGIQYLLLVNCLERKEEEIMLSNFDNVFEKYQCGLDTNVKKALVLTGALVQQVLNIQLHEIKSTPFIKNLKSLQLREEEVKGLVAQAVNKMIEYGYYSEKSKEIVEEISKLIFKSNDKWKLSVDEINFYIVAGMALQKEIYGKEEETENE